jgi:Fe-S-cluster containining protein
LRKETIAKMIDTVYAHIQFIGRNGFWSINLPFVCTKCGVCCILDDFLTAGPVKAKLGEYPEVENKLQAIYDYLEKLLEGGEEKYDEYVLHTSCPFVKDKECTIYSIRPDGCRQFPNTPFGMLSKDCEALDRFKKQIKILKQGRGSKVTFHFTTEVVKESKLSPQQYDNCVLKLGKVGITDEELALMKVLNRQ